MDRQIGLQPLGQRLGHAGDPGRRLRLRGEPEGNNDTNKY